MFCLAISDISFLFQDMLALQREVPSSPLESHSETDVATSELDTTGPSDVENLGAAKLKEKVIIYDCKLKGQYE